VRRSGGSRCGRRDAGRRRRERRRGPRRGVSAWWESSSADLIRGGGRADHNPVRPTDA
jgi:hypothetical protein